jgi:hypothetical protein
MNFEGPPINKTSATTDILKCLCVAMKVYWGSTYIAPHILNLGAKGKRVAALTPQPVYPGQKKSSSMEGEAGIQLIL